MSEREQIYKNLEDAPTIYVNSIQVAQSPFDLRLVMGVLEAADTEKIVTRVNATVFMSMQHAKVFVGLLQKHMEKYKSIHGTINIDRGQDRPVESVEDMLSREES